jgi:hypothetical protein
MNNNMTGQSTKDHKFFERFLDTDLGKLTNFLQDKYDLIDSAKLAGVTPLDDRNREKLGDSSALHSPDYKPWVSSGSLSTVKWTEYNVFQFYNSEIHKLYKSISDMVKEACTYYDIDFDKQDYYVQGWFNINHSHVGKLDWHDHGGPGAPFFHGYYCVSAEPSITHYKLFNDNSKIVENHNLNNRAIVSEMGHPHAMGDWSWDGPRITIAYDIIPLQTLIDNGEKVPQQHWIPLI